MLNCIAESAKNGKASVEQPWDFVVVFLWGKMIYDRYFQRLVLKRRGCAAYSPFFYPAAIWVREITFYILKSMLT